MAIPLGHPFTDKQEKVSGGDQRKSYIIHFCNSFLELGGGKNLEPLICKPDDIIDLFKEGLEIDAPISEFIIEYNEQKHEIGVSADYSREREFYNIDFYLDEQHFSTLDELCKNARIDGVRFVDIDIIKVLEMGFRWR